MNGKQGSIHYVATIGDDATGDGSMPFPWRTLKHALSQVTDGDAIWIEPGDYEETGQLVVDHNLWIAGWGWDQTTLTKSEDTGDPSSGSARAWFLVQPDKFLELSHLTLDGAGRRICIGVLSLGQVWVRDCHVRNIRWNSSAPDYYGRGICTYGGAGQQNAVADCVFENIGRIGVFTFGAGVWTQVSDVTYTGKGIGDHLDYAFEAGGGAELTVYCSNVSACRGVAVSDGSTSAGVFGTTYFGPGTVLSTKWNVITDCATAVAVGYDGSDVTGAPDIGGNDFSGNEVAIGNSSATNLVNAPINWYGYVQPADVAGQVTGCVDYSPWLAIGAGLPVPQPAPCFNPDLSVLWVDDDSDVYDPLVGFIGEAVALVSGDTVHVAPGSYVESVSLNVPDLNLVGPNAGIDPCTSVRGPEAVIASTNPSGTLQIVANGVTIDGVKITGGVYGILAMGAFTGLTVRNTIIDGPSDDGINLWTSTGGWIHHNQIVNCPLTGIAGGSTDASAPTQALIEHNCITNTRLGITGYHSGSTIRENLVNTFGLAPPAAGISGQLLNTTVSGNAVSGYTYGAAIALTAYGARPHSSNVAITSNDLASNAGGIHFDAAATLVGVTANYNKIYGNTVAGLQNLSPASLDATCNWWGDALGPNVPPANPSPGDDLAGSASYAPWWTTATGPCDGFGPNNVAANAEGICVSGATPCATVPVVFTRSDPSAARAVSVTFELSSNLELCDTPPMSVLQGGWLAGYGTTFQVVDNGGGSYTVDQAILGSPCGVTSGGTLFTVGVKMKAGFPDGTGVITVTDVVVRDCGNAPLAGIPGSPATITIDTAPPAAVANLAAAQVKSGNDSDGTTKVTLTFTAPPDAATVEVYRAGFGNYPEYDDAPGAGSVPPAPSYPPPAPWALTGATASGQTDETPWPSRDFWYYVAFAKDACGNVSAVSNKTGGTLNYHLGDVHNGTTDCTGNNIVSTSDVSFLGSHYGITLGVSDPLACLDIGPTHDSSVDGRPMTDNQLQFEDLMMFAINHMTVSKGSNKPVAEPLDALTVEVAPGRPGEMVARLILQGSGRIQGLSAMLAWEGAAPLSMTPGELIESNGAVALSPEPGAVDAAVLGTSEAGFAGAGVLATITFRVQDEPRIALASVEARDARNARVDLALVGVHQGQSPKMTELLPAVPNPFNPVTTLRYRLSKAGLVELAVFSVDGRIVRMLVSATRPPGEDRVTWDGRDERGSPVASGQYYVRLRTSEVVHTRTLTLVK
jgi:hypothetical protein